MRALLSEAISLFALLHFYPLAGEAWEQIKHQLGQIHQDKEKRYLEAHGDQFAE